MADGMEVVEAELWQLVDQRLDQVRRLPYDALLRRSARDPEIEGGARGSCRNRVCMGTLLHVRILGASYDLRIAGGLPVPSWLRRADRDTL